MVRRSNGNFKLSAFEITPSHTHLSFRDSSPGGGIVIFLAVPCIVPVLCEERWWVVEDEPRPCTLFITNRHNISLPQSHVFISNLHVSYNTRGE